MGYKIRELRIEKHLSQDELARISGVSRVTLSGLESGRIKNTTSGTLLKLAEALGTTIEKLFLRITLNILSKKILVQEVKGMKCPHCGAECKDGANFCKKCGGKLRKVCQCWVFNELYNCGHEECPGLGLIVEEMKESQAETGFNKGAGDIEKSLCKSLSGDLSN